MYKRQDYIQDQVGDDAEIIFGHSSDTQLKEHIRVTVIATGFQGKNQITMHRARAQSLSTMLPRNQQTYLFEKQSRRSVNDPYLIPTSGVPVVRAKMREQEASTAFVHTLDSLERRKHYPRRNHARIDETLMKQEGTLSEEKIKEWLAIPAYLRKDVRLSTVAPSLDQEIIRYRLDGDKTMEEEQSHSRA